MVLRGHIKNGTIVLDEPQSLPEGAEVEVSFLPPPVTPAEASEEREIPTLYERLKPFIGKLDGLPPDASINHDHYLYGTPKKSP
ncbi:MAG TPA: hypothetical protein VMP01_05680 [Pirellulaceae bacterium]|nr:hypothetical protein [Pirellulaceae bacterium]